MRLLWMLRKEMRQYLRDPALVRMTIVVPLMQTVLLSYAANFDVTTVPVTICDEARTPESRHLIEQVAASPYFDLSAQRLGAADLDRDLDRGTAALALHIPPTFSRDLARGRATVQILVDGSDSNTATVAAGYLAGVANSFDQQLRLATADQRGRRLALPQVEVRTRILFNADLRSLWFMAPAVLALALTVLMQGLTSLAIAKEREVGTLEQLVMTPLRPAEIMLGKLLPYGLVGCLSAVLVTAFVIGVLRVPFRGSYLVLSVGILFFLFATLGLGLVVSAVSQNQQQAQLINFFLSFPSMLLSGFMFPVSNLPDWLRWFASLVPMAHYLEICRGCFLRGSGFDVLGPHLAWLLGLSSVFFALGALRFRKRLD